MTRKALGRGLNALIREVELASSGLEEVPVTLIDASPFQPRHSFPEESLKELADSIRSNGLVQPVLLRRSDARFQLIAGERRWRAAQIAGLGKIPAIVRELTDREALELALAENLLREDLNPLDVAHAFEALQQQYRLSHDQIAERVGVNRSTVTNTLRLLRLPAKVQKMLSDGELTTGHARALLGIDSDAFQTRLADTIVKRGLSVRQVEEMVSKRQGRISNKKPNTNELKLDPNVRAAILELERVLGTRVKIVGSEEKGRIEISYFSPDDLSRIYDWIVRPLTTT